MEQRKVSVITTIVVILPRNTAKLGVTQLTQKRDGIGVLYQRVMVSIKLSYNSASKFYQSTKFDIGYLALIRMRVNAFLTD